MKKLGKVLLFIVVAYVVITIFKALIWHQFITCNWYGTAVYAVVWPTLIIDGYFETNTSNDVVYFLAPGITPEQLFGCKSNYEDAFDKKEEKRKNNK